MTSQREVGAYRPVDRTMHSTRLVSTICRLLENLRRVIDKIPPIGILNLMSLNLQSAPLTMAMCMQMCMTGGSVPLEKRMR